MKKRQFSILSVALIYVFLASCQISLDARESIMDYSSTSKKEVKQYEFPSEVTPDMEKNQGIILDAVNISEMAAMGIAEILHMVGVPELRSAKIKEIGEDFKVIIVKDINGDKYEVTLGIYDVLQTIWKAGDNNPIYFPRR